MGAGEGGAAAVRGAGRLAKGAGGCLVGGSERLLVWPDLGHTNPAGYYAQASGEQFRELCGFSLSVGGPYDTTMHYPLVDGRFIVRMSDRLVCYDLRAASAEKQRKHFSLNGGHVRSSPPALLVPAGTERAVAPGVAPSDSALPATAPKRTAKPAAPPAVPGKTPTRPTRPDLPDLEM